MMNEKLDLVGMTEIAQMLGVPRNRVNQWRFLGQMPVPITELSIGPIWHRSEIEEWAANRAAKSSV
jgi:predicted DNA-binding transcriptional regulator AlpA